MSSAQMNAVTLGGRADGAAPRGIVDAAISLVAGRGVAGYLGDGGPATLAQLNGPTGVAVDAAGGILVVDASNRVRRIAYGTITTVAGSGVAGHVSQGAALPEDGGPALDAQLNNPIGVALDLEGNILIADALYHRIRRVTPDGTITTIAGDGIPRSWAMAARPPPPTCSIRPPSRSTMTATCSSPMPRTTASGASIRTARSPPSRAPASPGSRATGARPPRQAAQADRRGSEPQGRAPHRRRVQPPHPPRGHPREDQHRRGRHRHPPMYGGLVYGAYGGDGGPATEAFLNFPTEVLVDGEQNLLIADSSNDRVRCVGATASSRRSPAEAQSLRRMACRPRPLPERRPHRHGVRRCREPPGLRGVRPSRLAADPNRGVSARALTGPPW